MLEELLATVCTYGVTIVWLGPRPLVLTWAFFNCFGLNFELWTAKFFAMEPFASLEVGPRVISSEILISLDSTSREIVFFSHLFFESYCKVVISTLLCDSFDAFL